MKPSRSYILGGFFLEPATFPEGRSFRVGPPFGHPAELLPDGWTPVSVDGVAGVLGFKSLGSNPAPATKKALGSPTSAEGFLAFWPSRFEDASEERSKYDGSVPAVLRFPEDHSAVDVGCGFGRRLLCYRRSLSARRGWCVRSDGVLRSSELHATPPVCAGGPGPLQSSANHEWTSQTVLELLCDRRGGGLVVCAHRLGDGDSEGMLRV
jgi:hypothetical protein